MRHGFRSLCALFLIYLVAVSVQAATVSPQQAEAFSRKVTQIQRQALQPRTVARRTAVSEDELNSWFTYSAQRLLPSGVTQPQVTILGEGRMSATAVVNLDEVAKQRASGSLLDPWNLVGGRVPLTVTGILHTREGQGRIELQRAEISGVPVPVGLVHELVTYYSRTERNPNGVRLDQAFALPSGIREIQVGPRQAVIVQ